MRRQAPGEYPHFLNELMVYTIAGRIRAKRSQIVREEIEQLLGDEIIRCGPAADEALRRRGVFAVRHSLLAGERGGSKPEMIHTGNRHRSDFGAGVTKRLN